MGTTRLPAIPRCARDVCSKAGVTDTIRAAADLIGQRLVDPGGLFLHTGHALRVTGSQALARAGLQELMIALQARWGSSAIRTYIRKAPLAAAHTMAAMAIAGWERNRNPAGPPTPFAASSASRATAQARRTTVARPAPGRDARADALQSATHASNSRVDLVNQQMQELIEWRASLQASIPAEPAGPAEAPEGEVPTCWNSIVAEFPFVYSINDKCHKVRVGFPEHPSRWHTFCSWPFGKSDVAN